LTTLIRFPQHPDQHRPEGPILLAIDQQLAEGPRLRVPPELADPVGALEAREPEDVEQLGARPIPRSLLFSLVFSDCRPQLMRNQAT
jgi:hypothetical protein